ncbi:hypothetical protein UlMin_018370 [Ulmus minor]
MQHAIPYRTWLPELLADDPRPPALSDHISGAGESSSVQIMVSENALIVFGKRGCCMCHVVKRLLLGHGVNPRVFEVDDDGEAAVLEEISKSNGEGKSETGLQFPVVFVGGKVFGGLEKVIATHISGELVPILRQAGALWL